MGKHLIHHHNIEMMQKREEVMNTIIMIDSTTMNATAEIIVMIVMDQ